MIVGHCRSPKFPSGGGVARSAGVVLRIHNDYLLLFHFQFVQCGVQFAQ